MKQLLKGTKLYSILFHKCPRCHQGDLFYTSTYSFKNFFGMPKTCPHCGQRYELETGFYYGAMYVSYGVSVAIGVAFYVAFAVLYPSFEILEYLLTTVVGYIILIPWIFRVSRAIWINFFVSYKKEAESKGKDWQQNQSAS